MISNYPSLQLHTFTNSIITVIFTEMISCLSNYPCLQLYRNIVLCVTNTAIFQQTTHFMTTTNLLTIKFYGRPCPVNHTLA